MPVVLLSVSDKTGLVDFAAVLVEQGWTLVASGGTARTLREANFTVTEVSDVTGAPEMLEGRVKTLHPHIHAGILARPAEDDQAELKEHGITMIDMVVCNLYPFQKTVARADVSLNDALENIDIGGVALLRAAAKNFSRVIVVSDPADYPILASALQNSGFISTAHRRELAVKAFMMTAQYDTAITQYLTRPEEGLLPDILFISMPSMQTMRYGENPHQEAALYASPGTPGPLGGKLLQGKPLSYNNLLDLDAAWRAVQSFEQPAVVIVKHLSPCGIAVAENLAAAFPGALASDPVSAFGGVIAVNQPFDADIAAALGDLFVEAIVAPGFTPDAREILASRKNCRLVEIEKAVDTPLELRTVAGGVLVQQRDVGDPASAAWTIPTKRQPTESEMTALKFAWKSCQHIKSNAIVFAHERATVGIGGGLPSRVDAVKLAATKAGDHSNGAVMASDAFFPFPDGIEAAAEAGVTAVIQPGGSIRDEAVIAAADELNLAMVFTGTRHFRH